MSQPVGDLVIDLSLDAVRFDEQMSRVRRHFSGLDTDARKTASAVEQGLSRQALAAQKAGISVGQYKAAMRTLPAQFTDIATQLAGGQNPWLILLQQGGQVKDSFGGMIPMFRGLAGAITLPMVGVTAVQHVPEKEAIVDNGAHFDGDQSGTVNGVTPPAVQHLTAEVTADSGEYQVLARWDTPKVVKGVSFMLRLTVTADDGSERLVSTARTTETTYRFTQLALGNYRLTVRAVNAWGQQGDPASVSFRIAAPAAPSRIELTPGYFQITATPHLAVYDPTVQFEFWFSEKRIADIRQVETTARYLGTALYWIAASINIRPGHNYYFYVRSVNTVGKSAFVEAVGQPSDDASGYLDFFKGEIGKTHLAQELWTQIDNGQLAPDLAEIRTSITNVSNEITQTVNKKLEDQSAAIQQIQKVQVDTNNNLNSMWAVKLQQMQDGRLYIAGIGAGIENTPDGMQSQVLLAADRIAMVNPANGNTKPMFVGQGDQIFMNDVFLKRLTAPTITSGGNPPAFSLTPDGKLTANMQCGPPGICIQLFTGILCIRQINRDRRKILFVKNNGATIKQRRPVFMLLECIQHCGTNVSVFHRFIAILSCCFSAYASSLGRRSRRIRSTFSSNACFSGAAIGIFTT